jgi:tRNA-Thr(GGU) m(6)t(6)A37 methyltransferase TsaA
MKTSRRTFITRRMPQAAIAGLAANRAVNGQAAADDQTLARADFKLSPIGVVEKQGEAIRLRLFDAYAEGLLGLPEWSHVNVIYWFDRNDTEPQRRILRVHPRADKTNPLTGVFACRAPVRPNLIGLSVCKILSVQGNLVTVDELDAFDSTPILDLKPFIPPDEPRQNVRVLAWAKANQTGNR